MKPPSVPGFGGTTVTRPPRPAIRTFSWKLLPRTRCGAPGGWVVVAVDGDDVEVVLVVTSGAPGGKTGAAGAWTASQPPGVSRTGRRTSTLVAVIVNVPFEARTYGAL